MVNSRKRTAASICCCLAASSVSAHDNGRIPPESEILPMHQAMLTSSPLIPRSTQTRNKPRRLGTNSIHSKGNSKSSEDSITPMSSTTNQQNEPAAMDYIMLGSGTTLTSTPLEEEEEPATNLSPYTRIGGSQSYTVQNDRYPYMASLQMEGLSLTSGKFDYHMCGGFLIAPDLILTSAHCAEYTPPDGNTPYQAFNGIEVGRTNLGKEVAYDAMDLHTYHLEYENLIPEKLIKHPHFDATTYEHDLMIVKVFGKSRYDYVLVDRGDVGGGEEITVIGWGGSGAENNGKQYSDELREADLLVMDNQSCKATSLEVKNPGTGEVIETTLEDNISPDMMCATARNRYICNGDGGGPAIRRGNTPQEDRVVGIVSWGYGCMNPDYPAVMTRTAEHEQWIRTIICKESTDAPPEYGCGNSMTLNSATVAKQTVTLKLKLDRMAVETGFVIVSHPEPSVVAQRVPGYYKIRDNDIVEEPMDLPSNQCYKLILLDSFGDGFCCDMGGGSAKLYLGTDTGYYSGTSLVEVKGGFEYDSAGEFCLGASSFVPANDEEMPAVANPSSGGASVPAPSPGSGGSSSVSSGSGPSENESSSNNSPSGSNNDSDFKPSNSNNGSNSSGSGGNQGIDSNKDQSGWSGPVTSPEFSYCNQFCNNNAKALSCGKHSCYHSGASATDSQENESSGGKGNGGSGSGSNVKDDEEKEEFDPEGHASNPDEYYLTAKFKFDAHPQDVSWVLYDLSANKVRMFVDFGVYTEEKFANQVLEVVVNVEGPEAGEKQYAFTVYDKDSNGLCCDHGKGWYKLYLGDPEDDMKLLGDSKYDFSSSYYFTLFEDEEAVGNMTENFETTEKEEGEETASPSSSPTETPTEEPTISPLESPTTSPTKSPSVSPTQAPSHSPTTPKPTFPWEVKRSELMEEIGARWNTASVTPPKGKFNDIGGDPRNFDFTADLQRSGGASRFKVMFGLSAYVLSCAYALL